jgi:hypothetical protein
MPNAIAGANRMHVVCLLLLLHIAAVLTQCPKGCSNHGQCTGVARCECYGLWTQGDCSQSESRFASCICIDVCVIALRFALRFYRHLQRGSVHCWPAIMLATTRLHCFDPSFFFPCDAQSIVCRGLSRLQRVGRCGIRYRRGSPASNVLQRWFM